MQPQFGILTKGSLHHADMDEHAVIPSRASCQTRASDAREVANGRRVRVTIAAASCLGFATLACLPAACLPACLPARHLPRTKPSPATGTIQSTKVLSAAEKSSAFQQRGQGSYRKSEESLLPLVTLPSLPAAAVDFLSPTYIHTYLLPGPSCQVPLTRRHGLALGQQQERGRRPAGWPEHSQRH